MLRPSFWSMPFAQGPRRSWGFTLLELMMVVSIIAILASLALPVYRLYVLKAEESQALVNYGHIRTVLAVKTYADGEANLEHDSVPGAVPPALAGSMGASEFNGKDGMTFQLIRAPAGTFASFPKDDTYALVATVNNLPGVVRLRVLRSILPHGDGDKIWVQSSADASSAQLIYPINIGGAGGQGGTVAGGGGGGGSSGSQPPGGGTTITEPGSPGGSNGGTSNGSTDESTGSGSNPGGSSSAGGGASGGTSPGNSGESNAGTGTVPPASGGGSIITVTGTNNGGSWTADVHICIGAASGGPLTGQNNTSVIFTIVTPYANFQENLKIDSATGCVDRSYGGLPLGGNFHVEVNQVVDYNPPTNGATSPLWDGVKPSFNQTVKP